MAGLSSRFTKAGFTLPKYMLYVGNKSLFHLAINSFNKYFTSCRFVFIARDIFNTPLFVERECTLMGIKNFTIISLDYPTRGQAETVCIGIKEAAIPNNEPILIFNIDTFRPGFTIPPKISEWDGYLEVFKGSGTNWSYARTESSNSTRVVETAEKKEISDNCSTGIYFFTHAEMLVQEYNEICESQTTELYIAPLYNRLIAKGYNIHVHIIKREEVIFCGIPQEYYDYIKLTIKYNREEIY